MPPDLTRSLLACPLMIGLVTAYVGFSLYMKKKQIKSFLFQSLGISLLLGCFVLLFSYTDSRADSWEISQRLILSLKFALGIFVPIWIAIKVRAYYGKPLI